MYLSYLLCLFCLDVLILFGYDLITRQKVRVIYNCPADSLITIDIPPRKKTIL